MPEFSDPEIRGALIGFLRAVSKAQHGGPPVEIPPTYMVTPINLKQLPPEERVASIRSCRDSYFVTTGDGRTRAFWDQSLRFETDASRFGPPAGKPVILGSGMFGDRAAVIFASPREISAFIEQQC